MNHRNLLNISSVFQQPSSESTQLLTMHKPTENYVRDFNYTTEQGRYFPGIKYNMASQLTPPMGTSDTQHKIAMFVDPQEETKKLMEKAVQDLDKSVSSSKDEITVVEENSFDKSLELLKSIQDTFTQRNEKEELESNPSEFLKKSLEQLNALNTSK